jgi:putative membrane protein
MSRRRRLLPPILLGVVVLALVFTGIRPYDRLTWFLEVFWVILGIPLVLLTWRRFPFTTLLCWLLTAHALILIVGGYYTYARTPVGYWLQDLFNLSRNPYDRVGHFAQGFIPAILVREILVRRSPLRGSRWLAPLVACACLAFSAFFEMIEWWAALAAGSAADDFLATQGDVWDTQWDMFLAFIGAILSLLVFSRLHDRQLRSLLSPVGAQSNRDQHGTDHEVQSVVGPIEGDDVQRFVAGDEQAKYTKREVHRADEHVGPLRRASTDDRGRDHGGPDQEVDRVVQDVDLE